MIRTAPSNGGFKVLIADDDPDVLFLSSAVLGKAGYSVLQASTGKECLEAAKTHHPDIILLDVILPDIMGVEVCSRIKDDPDLQHTIVILVSGIQVSSDFQADALNLCADGYIVKPISNKEFLARIQAMERIKRAENALREKEKSQQKLIQELQEALAEIKTLKGLIPICASCKKIRDDKGYWNQLEAYISAHTDAVFSHGLCPECAEKVRAELKLHTKTK